jgi:hypothetical protein
VGGFPRRRGADRGAVETGGPRGPEANDLVIFVLPWRPSC